MKMNWWNCTPELALVTEIIFLLAHKHNVVISIRTLKRLCQKRFVFVRKNNTSMDEEAMFMQAEMERM